MLFQDKKSGDLIRVEDLDHLISPFSTYVLGRAQSGEEEQDESLFEKERLAFPSGESLPHCWQEANYRGDAKRQRP